MVKSSKKKSRFSVPSLGKVIKKAAGNVKQTARTAKAATQVAATLANPVNQAKIAVNAARGKGIVYPGSKYIGPGNPLPKGGLKKAKSKADAAAYQHDHDYDKLLKRGVKPSRLYRGFSDADQRLIDRSDTGTEHGLVTSLGMHAKKAAWRLGLTGKKIKDRPALGGPDPKKLEK